MKKLTPKQQLFVAEYLVDLNATQAAIRAGYNQNSANMQAGRMIVKDNIQAAIQKAMAKRTEKIGRTALEVLKDIQEVTKIARNCNDFRAALKGLELEGKHIGMFIDRQQISGNLTITWQR